MIMKQKILNFLMLTAFSLLLIACGGGSESESPSSPSQTPSTDTDNAQVFHVATTGDDRSGDGSLNNPWASINHALGSVSDSSTIIVAAGTYVGRIRLQGDFTNGVTVRSKVPYQAKLRHDATVVTCYYGKGITLSGFDIAHSTPDASALVVQIQNLLEDDTVSRIVLENNIIHDSYNNDILKINNGVNNITIRGNIFYNQSDSDEHIDINSAADITVEDNIFFNDFEGSNRKNENSTSSYIVIKDSNDDDDQYLGSQNITIKRNVFLNWQGSEGHNFVLIGEDGKEYFEAKDIMVENNLFLGNSSNLMRSPFAVKSGKDIVFRNNTVVGDLPSRAFAMRVNSENSEIQNENIQFYNNIWSDPTGSMGAIDAGSSNDFSDTPIDEIHSFSLNSNLYWNGDKEIPLDSNDFINHTDDTNQIIDDPLLPIPTNIVLPRLTSENSLADNSNDIKEAFKKLVELYGIPEQESAVIDHANAEHSPIEDILKRPRVDGSSDIGAYER